MSKQTGYTWQPWGQTIRVVGPDGFLCVINPSGDADAGVPCRKDRDTAELIVAALNTYNPQVPQWAPDGMLLDQYGQYLAEWPEADSDGTIRIRDEHGNSVEVLRRTDEGADGARWRELRNLMPDDALYFQPDEAGDPDSPASSIRSYEVYRNYENASRAHPGCDILAFTGCDIEQPKFLDVENPKLFWNTEEE